MCRLLFVVVPGLLNAVTSLVAEHGLLNAVTSLFAEHGLNFSEVCGIFPDEGSNLCSRHWQADSLFTAPPGKSLFPYLKMQNTVVYEENENEKHL